MFCTEILTWNIYLNIFLLLKKKLQHSSQFDGLSSTKSFREMVQNLPYFWNKKIPNCIFRFSFRSSYFGFCYSGFPGLWKTMFGFSYFKNMTNFESISLDLFIEHKTWNCEECCGLLFRSEKIHKSTFPMNVIFLNEKIRDLAKSFSSFM